MNRIVFSVLASFIMSSCGSDGGDEKNSAQCDGVQQSEKHFGDKSGDAAFSFIDMVSLDVIQTDTTITAEITLLDIPSSFTYNNVNVPDNYLEYGWEIQFDVDCDGTFANDIQLAVTHFKIPGSVESQGELLSFTQNNIWESDETGDGFYLIDNLSASVEGSKLVLSVERSVYDRLLDINSKTPLRFWATHNASGSSNFDFFPDGFDNYVN